MRDAMRLVNTVSRMTQKEAEAFNVDEALRGHLIRYDGAKLNIAPPPHEARWFQLASVPLGNATDTYPAGDHVQVAAPWLPPKLFDHLPTPIIHRILEQIDAGLANGQRYSPAPSAQGRAAWRVVCERAPDKTEAQARQIIRLWCDSGLLISEDYDDPVVRRPLIGLRTNRNKWPD
jgi:hypothetical protein